MKHFFQPAYSFKGIVFALALMTCIPDPVHSQVGFDNPDPDSSALIDMKARDKGLLIPRMTTADRDAMTANGRKPAHALMVFDMTHNMFFMYDTITVPNRWVAMNPWVSKGTAGADIITATSGNVGIGTSAAPAEKLEVNGKVKAVEFIGHGTIPVGGIIMWSGDPNAIPAGWALCNGANGTPDLSGRFIVGYDMNDQEYNNTNKVGPQYTDADGASTGSSTQDAKAIRLTSAQSGVAVHSHKVNDPGHAHNHSDNHAPETGNKYGNGGNRAVDWNADAIRSTDTQTTGITIANNEAQHAEQAFENRPPFYVLAFLIRIQ